MYTLKIKGVIPLIELEDKILNKLSKVIEEDFSSYINLSNLTLYINGEIEPDELDNFRVLLIKIYNVIDISEDIVIKVKGDRVDDRQDYMINKTGIYLYKYQLVRELEPETIMTI